MHHNIYIFIYILRRLIPQLPAKYVGSKVFKCHFMMKSTQVNYWFPLKSGECTSKYINIHFEYIKYTISGYLR